MAAYVMLLEVMANKSIRRRACPSPSGSVAASTIRVSAKLSLRTWNSNIGKSIANPDMVSAFTRRGEVETGSIMVRESCHHRSERLRNIWRVSFLSADRRTLRIEAHDEG